MITDMQRINHIMYFFMCDHRYYSSAMYQVNGI